jgi:tripartite-type tricarboxylate transporter receptor subunit TctC
VRISTFAVALATFAFAGPAQSQDWPQRQVTIVVPFTAGGTTDMFGRILAQGLQQKYGTPFVVDNRAGAGGNVGAAAVARAAKDGNTLLVGTVSTHAINPFIYKNLQHDTVKDFQPVSLIARLPNMLVVNPKIPAKNLAELVAHLKQNPGKLSYGSSGAGTSTHLAAELFQLRTGTKMVHVPYRSSGDVMNALIGGHIDLAFDNITLAWPQVKAGTLRALGVTSAQPSATAPEVPPIAGTLAGFEATSWHGLRTGRHATPGRRCAVRRGEAHLRGAGRAEDAVRGRRSAVTDDARAVRRVHRRRAPQVAGRRAGGGRRGAVGLT